MRKITRFLLAALIGGAGYLAFCSCSFLYVAKADGKLFSEASQVIVVRDGNHTTITIQNDFQGDVSEFAMVIPVPEILPREQIRVLSDDTIFYHLQDYTDPYIELHSDNEPCYTERDGEPLMSYALNFLVRSTPSPYVNEEAHYTIGEYEIAILSATESDGLQTWLTNNGYKIPAQAEEVLEPYVKSGMKFFVAKVNLGAYNKLGVKNLRPIQFSFNSPKFMLPIRLGMANSVGYQDLIIYAFTRDGMIEPVNYRLSKIPTDRNIPLFVEQNFDLFYKAVFDHAWQNNPSALFLEYARPLDEAPIYEGKVRVIPNLSSDELIKAGAFWVASSEDAFLTRLHVRYNRENFPQDLVFQTTPNQENFQVRFPIISPQRREKKCEGYGYYVEKYALRRKAQVEEFTNITGLTEQQFLLMCPAASYNKGWENEFDIQSIGAMRTIPSKRKISLSKNLLTVLMVVGVVSVILYISRRKN